MSQPETLTGTYPDISSLLLRWQELRGQRASPSLEELGVPLGMREEVRERIQALERMEGLLGMGAAETPPDRDPGPPLLGPDTVSIPGHRILGILNRGGMGVVYKAWQVGLERPVAIKMILSGRHASAEQRARFRTEAEAVARLRHPHVVQIHEVGECAGQPYFTMEYVEGGNLADHLARGPLPSRDAATLLASLARAIHHAHQQGILHRDLKPANILLQRGEGREAKGEDQPSALVPIPKIADFGLARRLDAEEGQQTRTGSVLGTPSYMAPEQAEGKTREIGSSVDIYALGAILYECLTGQPPFRGETAVETLTLVRTREPVSPSRLRPGLPRDLETICLKCLNKDPHQRYATAHDLAEDLERFLTDRPIQARRTPWWERSARWARRRPALAALTAVSVLAVVGLLAVWVGFTASLQHERNEAITLRQQAEKERDRANSQSDRAQQLLKRALNAIQEHARSTILSRNTKQVEGDPGSIVFVVARAYAAAADTYRIDACLAERDRHPFVEQYDEFALTLLEAAAEHGYFNNPANRAKLTSEPPLAHLRKYARFRKLLGSEEEK